VSPEYLASLHEMYHSRAACYARIEAGERRLVRWVGALVIALSITAGLVLLP
jgi:hypothetical protein